MVIISSIVNFGCRRCPYSRDVGELLVILLDLMYNTLPLPTLFGCWNFVLTRHYDMHNSSCMSLRHPEMTPYLQGPPAFNARLVTVIARKTLCNVPVTKPVAREYFARESAGVLSLDSDYTTRKKTFECNKQAVEHRTGLQDGSFWQDFSRKWPSTKFRLP